MLEDKASIIATKILDTKYKLIGEGKSPRLVLLDHETHALIEEAWVRSIKELPWGDTLEYELQQRKDKQDIFLSDGSLYGLWVVVVDTIEGFRVY